MRQTDDEAQFIGQYALVSYITGPLAEFLDALRLELTPGSNPHAHVTVLPPRPLCQCADDAIRHLSREISDESRPCAPFRIELGAVEIFPESNVVYMDITAGSEELRNLYCSLNCGSLQHADCFPYHPHITIAQHITGEEAVVMAATARERWAAWRGPRSFEISSVSFVRNVAPTVWEDLAALPLGVEAAAIAG